MSAIERCRTAALRGHVACCENSACGYTLVGSHRLVECRRRRTRGNFKCVCSWLSPSRSACFSLPEHHNMSPETSSALTPDARSFRKKFRATSYTEKSPTSSIHDKLRASQFMPLPWQESS